MNHPFIQRCDGSLTTPAPVEPTARPAVFFDRDGTLNIEKNYLHTVKDLILFPDAIASLRQLQRANFPLYIFTNQAGIAHGIFTESLLQQIHQELLHQLTQAGIDLSGILYCPHHPNAEIVTYRCNCFGRKPQPGMLYQAARQEKLNLQQSYIVGDKLSDIQAGKTAGTKTILVLTGYGTTEQYRVSEASQPDYIAPNLEQAAQWILADWEKS